MQKTAMVSRGELTFQDIYGAEALLNEEDEDGYSDWEPVQQKMPVEFVKWCCFSCTMANPGDMVHCYVYFAYFFMFEYFVSDLIITSICNYLSKAWIFCISVI